mgnify:CR=1 FL=1
MPNGQGRQAAERILAAAARLFAAHGVAGTGLREITTEAGVNLAAVNYHFGSKEGLLESLIERSARPLVEERMRLLAECAEGPGRPPMLEQWVTAGAVDPSDREVTLSRLLPFLAAGFRAPP